MKVLKSNNIKIKIEKQVITIKNLPQDFSGIRIAHLSDIHSSWFGRKERKILEKVQELNPDFVFITGDFVDTIPKLMINRALAFTRPFWQELGERYRGRIFGVLGNHDNKLVENCLKMSGIKILDNENQKIWLDKNFTYPVRDFENFNGGQKEKEDISNKVYLIGIDDSWTGRDDLSKAIEGIEENIPKILLTHSPDIIDKAIEQKIDLVLAGHTHGGQIKIPLIYHLWMKVLSKYGVKYTSGLFKIGSTHLYVNRGIGTSLFPIRFNCPSEIALIELKK